MSEPARIRPASHEDRAVLAASLAAAFQDDPVMAWIFPWPGARKRRLPALFARLFDEDSAAGACFMSQTGDAATFWQGPDARRLSLLGKLAEFWPWFRATGPSLLRAVTFSDMSDANRPAMPHWYLHVAGCAPASQGKGLGRAVIRAGLEKSDADGVPAYLETGNQANVGYYETLGFKVTHTWTVAGQLKCWSMERPPHLVRPS